MEVIPTINCHEREFGCVAEQVRVAGTLKGNEWIHLDVADGVFTFNKTWNVPERWGEFQSRLKLEVHLMVENPEGYVSRWLEAGAQRLIIHAETVDKDILDRIKEEAHGAVAEIMLALNPETSIEKAERFFDDINAFQVLGVHPGPSGQLFLPLVLQKVKTLRDRFPDAIIEVDGGMNNETAPRAVEAGANVIAAGSYIFGNENPKKAYEKLFSILDS